MAVFPDITCFEINESIVDGMEWQTGSSGKDWGADRWAGENKRVWKFNGPAVTLDEEAQISAFYEANKSTFYYFANRKKHAGAACDETGTGSLDVFTIPGKSGSGFTVYEDGVEVNEANYTINAGTGTNGEDQIQFDEGQEPADGAIITVDFTGRRRYLTRFNGGLTSYPKSYEVFGVSFNLIEVFV